MALHFSNPMLYGVRWDSAVKSKFLMQTWMKFAEYLREDEKEFLNNIKDKNALDLSVQELEKYKSIKNQMEFSKLLPKYEQHNCTREEYDLVSDFFDKNSLKDFMRSRLTDEEARESLDIVDDLKDEELPAFIKEQESVYDNLSVFQTYTLYLANSRLKYIDDCEFNERMRRETIERNQALIRRLARDYGFRVY